MIGYGDETEKKSGPGLYKSSGSRLKGVYKRTEDEAHAWVKRYKDPTDNSFYLRTSTRYTSI